MAPNLIAAEYQIPGVTVLTTFVPDGQALSLTIKVMLQFFLTCYVTEHVVPGDVLLGEAPVANVAPERPHSAVHEAVALEVARRRERLVAHLAFVRLLLKVWRGILGTN